MIEPADWDPSYEQVYDEIAESFLLNRAGDNGNSKIIKITEETPGNGK